MRGPGLGAHGGLVEGQAPRPPIVPATTAGGRGVLLARHTCRTSLLCVVPTWFQHTPKAPTVIRVPTSELHRWAQWRQSTTTSLAWCLHTSGTWTPLPDSHAGGTRLAWGRAGSCQAQPPDAGAWHTEKQTNLGSAEKHWVHARTLYWVSFSAFSWQGNLGFPLHTTPSCWCWRLGLVCPPVSVSGSASPSLSPVASHP